MFVHLCGLGDVHVLSVFKPDYRVCLTFVLINYASSYAGVWGNILYSTRKHHGLTVSPQTTYNNTKVQ